MNKQRDKQNKQKKPILCRGIADFKGLSVILFIATVLDGYICSPENRGEITLIFMVFMTSRMVLGL
jgi:hypothetical protein